MKIANVKSMVAKVMMVGLAAGAFAVASPATAQAQQFGVGVQFGQPAYVVDHDGYRYDRDAYRYDRDDYRRREEFREHEAREAFYRRQAYLRQQQWQHEQWERSHHFDRDDYRR
jgi:hypothetical protein